MNFIAQLLPLFAFLGAVVGMTAYLSRRTKSDEERWTLDRRKRDRRGSQPARVVPLRNSGERRLAERRRVTAPSSQE
jgi:hypothetical protein